LRKDRPKNKQTGQKRLAKRDEEEKKKKMKRKEKKQEEEVSEETGNFLNNQKKRKNFNFKPETATNHADKARDVAQSDQISSKSIYSKHHQPNQKGGVFFALFFFFVFLEIHLQDIYMIESGRAFFLLFIVLCPCWCVCVGNKSCRGKKKTNKISEGGVFFLSVSPPSASSL
jgi:hypothetical protein